MTHRKDLELVLLPFIDYPLVVMSTLQSRAEVDPTGDEEAITKNQQCSLSFPVLKGTAPQYVHEPLRPRTMGGKKYAMTIIANRISIFSFLMLPRSCPLVSFIMSGVVDAVGISEKSKRLSFAEIR